VREALDTCKQMARSASMPSFTTSMALNASATRPISSET
jgi:hypothetical protein